MSEETVLQWWKYLSVLTVPFVLEMGKGHLLVILCLWISVCDNFPGDTLSGSLPCGGHLPGGHLPGDPPSHGPVSDGHPTP